MLVLLKKLMKVFIQMQIDQSISYYSSKYMKVLVMITNMLTQYCENFRYRKMEQEYIVVARIWSFEGLSYFH